MLNRAIASPAFTPKWWTEWRRGLTARQTKLLFRYVVVLAVLCVLGCVYLAQMNIITNLSSETAELEIRAVELEAANTILIVQLAESASPAAIAAQAEVQRLDPAQAPTTVRIPRSPTSSATQMTAGRSVAQAAEPPNGIP